MTTQLAQRKENLSNLTGSLFNTISTKKREPVKFVGT